VVLQINPEELAVGVRPVRRASGRLHGEVFIYDDVSGGAGYARAIRGNLDEILRKALELGENCSNPECAGACYHCLFDYRNQYLHPLLDRELGSTMLRYLLHGELPELDSDRAERAVRNLTDFAGNAWTVSPGRTIEGVRFACVLKDRMKNQFAMRVIHPVEVRPPKAEAAAVLTKHGIRAVTTTLFDLEKRPFWVLNNLA